LHLDRNREFDKRQNVAQNPQETWDKREHARRASPGVQS
jgi:hypothetical protein